jgi:hypothetical protein
MKIIYEFIYLLIITILLLSWKGREKSLEGWSFRNK